jgi:hypothetical protein
MSLINYATAVVLLTTNISCASEELTSKRTKGSDTENAQAEMSEDELSGLSLTQTQCNVSTNINKVTVSPRAQLFINSPTVLNDARAKVVNGVPGKWTFGYALREILELPAPGIDPIKLAAEQGKIDDFLNKYIQNTKVNTFTPSIRTRTRATILAAWGTTMGSDNRPYRTLDKAPFKLVAIVNRLDIVKKGKTGVTAGEGRFVYSFTGPGPMTVIFEYDLPIGTASNKGIATALDWGRKWQSLKTMLVDTNTAIAGVQPNQSPTVQPTFRDAAGYLTMLEGITELWANRTAQKRVGGSEASIAQIRTNEILDSEWELREIVRVRNAQNVATLQLTTVKNNPDQSLNNNAKLKNWLNTNVVCTTPTLINTCSYNTANAEIPATIPDGTARMAILGVTSPEPFGFRWFQSSSIVKERFFSIQTCNGCHTGDTNTPFVHVATSNGEPSSFLIADLTPRLKNFKNLVCLGAASVGALNLTQSPDSINDLRIEISPWTH